MGLLNFIFGGKSSNNTSDINDNDCDWYCDNCDAYMNNQTGFSIEDGEWICQECGYLNDVSEDNILYDDDDDDDYDDERISVYDAALIWASNGKDEDYMFGYTEDELEDAL